MKKQLPSFLLLTLLAVALFAACSDTVENVDRTGIDVVSAEAELTKCTGMNEGEMVFVLSENSMRVCIGGKWVEMAESIKDSIDLSGDASCKAVELADGSGLKIVCNGDSVGVMLNGEKGADGAAGKDGADGKNGTDGKDAVLSSDSEKVAIAFDSLVGYSQKGPFLKGSTVYLYELSDGRTLQQTNGNFTSVITRDDGRYKFTARDLVSQYAMIVVEGIYRNEVTGAPSDAAISLRAITDMRKRSDANINLLTHLEFNRVYHLVTQEGQTVKKAKRQAQKEILGAFLMDTTGVDFSAEDLDVFGASDADAALLAISILMQRDADETSLTELLTEISNDMETDGKWDNAATRALVADWATLADGTGRLDVFRDNVDGWKLSDTVPEFEKFIRNFYSRETELGICGSANIPVGTVKGVTNAKSLYYAGEYADTAKTKVRFVCANADSARWRVATDLEKDTAGLGHAYAEGDVVHGRINTDSVYVFENGNWRHGTFLDDVVGKGCVPARGDTVVLGSDDYWYKCVADTLVVVDESEWTSVWRDAEKIEMDTVTWGVDWNEGDIRNGRINTDSTYVFQDGHWRAGTPMDSVLRQACMVEGQISDTVYERHFYECKVYWDGRLQWVQANYLIDDTYLYRDGCKDGGEYADGRIMPGRLNDLNPLWPKYYVCDNGAFREATKAEIGWNLGCVSYNRGSSVVLEGQLSHYKCTSNGWVFDLENSSGSLEIEGRQYRTVTIGNQNWMAENLSVETENSLCYNNSADSCAKYGRLYPWGEAKTVCPDGWHLPDSLEWHALIKTAGGGEHLKSSSGWYNTSSGVIGNGSDDYGFTVLPGGEYSFNGASCVFTGVGTEASFWSSVDASYNEACYVSFDRAYGSAYSSFTTEVRGARSIRCVQNSNQGGTP